MLLTNSFPTRLMLFALTITVSLSQTMYWAGNWTLTSTLPTNNNTQPASCCVPVTNSLTISQTGNLISFAFTYSNTSFCTSLALSGPVYEIKKNISGTSQINDTTNHMLIQNIAQNNSLIMTPTIGNCQWIYQNTNPVIYINTNIASSIVVGTWNYEFSLDAVGNNASNNCCLPLTNAIAVGQNESSTDVTIPITFSNSAMCNGLGLANTAFILSGNINGAVFTQIINQTQVYVLFYPANSTLQIKVNQCSSYYYHGLNASLPDDAPVMSKSAQFMKVHFFVILLVSTYWLY